MKEQEHCISTTVLTVCKIERHLCIDKTFKSLVCLCMSHVCSSMQCLTVHKVCKEHSSQYYSRFHDPSRDLKATCQSTPFKRGSVSPSSAHSLRIHAMKEQKQEHCISTTVLTVCKIKRLLCIDKTFICLYTCHLCAYVFMSHVCSSMQCLTVHKVCKEHSSQYYSRFHDPSRDLKATCQSTPLKRGSVSPSSAHSLRIHAMKEEKLEYCISTTVLRVCKNKRLL